MKANTFSHRWAAWLLLLLPLGASAQVTLDHCHERAQANYPLIKRYDLIGQTSGINVSNISKGWLPQVSASAEAGVQNRITELPGTLRSMLSQQGTDIKGISKVHYRVGVSVTQRVWDGGQLRQKQEVERLQGEMESRQNDVALYGVRSRVDDLFFGVLLLDEQLRANAYQIELLASNEKKLEAMERRGTAMASDVSAVKAERLAAEQSRTDMQQSRQSLCRMLALFCGDDSISGVVKPTVADVAPDAPNRRPELTLYDLQARLADSQDRLSKASLMPTLSLYADGYFGYTGYDIYRDMFHRSPTLNGTIGARLTWNIGNLYTRSNERRRAQTLRLEADNSRDVFLFNSRLQQVQQREEVKKYNEMMRQDDDIVELRRQVRQSAEAKLAHGIIDVNDLLQQITRENTARTQRSLHEVEMLQHLSELRDLINQ